MGKVPLKLDWNDLLSSKGNEALPPEVEIVQSGDDLLVARLSDREIFSKIQRLCSNLASNFPDRLLDKGAKLRANLRQLQDEQDRRKLGKARKDSDKRERARQSETTESPGLCNDPSPCTATKSQHPSFASLFSKKLEERADPAPNGAWVNIIGDKCENSRKTGQRLHENRKPAKLSSQPAKTSSRSVAFQCASSLADKDSDCRVTEPSPSGRSFFNGLSKRKSHESHCVLNPKSTKVQDVVLLDEEELEPKQAILGDAPDDWKEVRIYYPSRDDLESVDISYSDIKCLDPEQYLTSPIMNFYIRYLQKPRSLVGRPRSEYHFFNTYFFGKLHEALSFKGDRNECFLKLRRWWKGVNIFQKAYIFLPIHGEMHWSLVIICIPAKEDESGPIILHLDSLGMHPSDKILDVVCCYLEEEWNYMNKNGSPSDLPIAERIWSNLPRKIERKKLRVPQQKNEYDCGLFVLYFMERFIDEAPERLRRKDLAMFGNKWFQPEEASGLRKRIRDLLIEEFENARFENGKGLESPASSCSSAADDVQQLIEV